MLYFGRFQATYLNWIAAIPLGWLLGLWYGQIDYLTPPMSGWDLIWYRHMAAAAPALATDVPQPYCFRVFGPYLAGLLPVSDETAFRWLSCLAAGGLTISLFTFLCHQGVRRRAALLTTVLFTLNIRILGFLVWDYFQLADLIALVCVLLLFDFLYREQWTAFCGALMVGVLTRETVLLVLAAAPLYLREKRSSRESWIALLLASVPALAIFALLRASIEPRGGLDLAQALSTHAPKLLSLGAWGRLLINSFLPVALIPFIAPRASVEFFSERRHLLGYIGVTMASTLFGTDMERLMAPAFVVVYLLVATLLDRELVCSRSYASLLILAGVIGSLHHTIGVVTLPGRTYTIALAAAALALGTSCAIAARAAAAKSNRSAPGRRFLAEDILLRAGGGL
jgi:hypothetical protein